MDAAGDDAETPLLQGDLDNRPCLSSGPPVHSCDDDGDGEFARLIGQSSTALLLAANGGNDDPSHPLHALARRYEDNRAAATRTTRETTAAPRRSRYWIIAGAGTCSLLHLGFIWGSYVADAWTRAYVTVRIGDAATATTTLTTAGDDVEYGYDDDYTSRIIVHHSWLLRSNSLASFLQDLNNHFWAMSVLWATCLLLPCAFMIASPSWILLDYYSRSSDYEYDVASKRPNHKRIRAIDGRSCLELAIRLALMVVFVILLLDLMAYFVGLNWTDTSIVVRNNPAGGFACFVIGISAALLFIIIMRHGHTLGFGDHVDSQERPFQSSPLFSASAIHSPPPHAFRHGRNPTRTRQRQRGSNRRSDVTSTGGEEADEEEVSMSVLEENAGTPPRERQSSTPPRRRHRPESPPSTPELVEEEHVQEAEAMLGQDSSGRFSFPCPPRISFCIKVLVYQSGLLATVFWMPSMHLPLLSFKYSGLLTAREIMPQTSFKIYLWELPHLVWRAQQQTAGSSGSPPRLTVLAIIVTTVLVITLFVVPIFACLFGLFAWIGEGQWSVQSRYWLYRIQPAMSGLVLVFTLMMLLPQRGGDRSSGGALRSLFESLLLGSGSDDGICAKIKKHGFIVDDEDADCLTLNDVKLLSGGWFFCAQSLLLEIFVAATLMWS